MHRVLQKYNYGFETVFLNPGGPYNEKAILHVLSRRCCCFLGPLWGGVCLAEADTHTQIFSHTPGLHRGPAMMG